MLSDGTIVSVDLAHDPGHCVLAIEGTDDNGTAWISPDPASLRLLAGFLSGLAEQMDKDAERARARG
jgi:hypothetical protein